MAWRSPTGSQRASSRPAAVRGGQTGVGGETGPPAGPPRLLPPGYMGPGSVGRPSSGAHRRHRRFRPPDQPRAVHIEGHMHAHDRFLPDWFDRIRSRQITLPRFQRFVAWSHTEVSGLLTTVLRGLPSGAALILQVGDEEKFKSRTMVDAPGRNRRTAPKSRRATFSRRLGRVSEGQGPERSLYSCRSRPAPAAGYAGPLLPARRGGVPASSPRASRAPRVASPPAALEDVEEEAERREEDDGPDQEQGGRTSQRWWQARSAPDRQGPYRTTAAQQSARDSLQAPHDLGLGLHPNDPVDLPALLEDQ